MFNAMKKGFGAVVGIWCGLIVTMYLNEKLIKKAEHEDSSDDYDEVS